MRKFLNVITNMVGRMMHLAQSHKLHINNIHTFKARIMYKLYILLYYSRAINLRFFPVELQHFVSCICPEKKRGHWGGVS